MNTDIKTTQHTNCEGWQCKAATPGKRTLDVTFPDMRMRALFQHSGGMKPAYVYMATSAKMSAFPHQYQQSEFILWGPELNSGSYVCRTRGWPLSHISNPKQFSFNTNASVPAITFYFLLFASYKSGIVSDGLQGFSLMFPGPTFCCLN